MPENENLTSSNDLRSSALWCWFLELCQLHQLGNPQGEIATVSGDASFRRYFRGFTDQGSWILVDAPPAHEDCRLFVRVQEKLSAVGVNVPVVVAADYQQGFMCLQDFGSQLLWPLLLEYQASQDDLHRDLLYQHALGVLLRIQRADYSGLPEFDAAMLEREMRLFPDWLCEDFLGMRLSSQEKDMLSQVFALLSDSALAQQQLLVHRDFHSRNLMLLDTGQRGVSGVGVLDFQDAVKGPITYDLVSLLKDCYVSWPADMVESWVFRFQQQALAEGVLEPVSQAQFLQDFHLMGVQRHLKAAGIFCRLCLRDGKTAYLQDIPRTLGYISTQHYQHEALNHFAAWLRESVIPVFMQKLADFQSTPQEPQS